MNASPVSTRLAGPQDEPFLRLLFASTDAVLVTLPPPLRPALLDMQFKARTFGYEADFPSADNFILLDAVATPIGRHLLFTSGNDFRTVDIAILPGHQRRGYATQIISDTQRQVVATGGEYRLSVLKTNPAFHLYRRLGFCPVAEDELSYEMLWTPDL